MTTPGRSRAAINAALAIQKLTDQHSGNESVIHGAVAAFKNKDFEKSYEIAVEKPGR